MSEFPSCPKCASSFTYPDRDMFVCPECGNEWSQAQNEIGLDPATEDSNLAPTYKDAFGNLLQDGDSIIVVKDLKIKGSSEVVKKGTKVKSIRLVDGIDGHDIDCKISGIGAIQLKSEFVKKAT
jgi:protein PhnA